MPLASSLELLEHCAPGLAPRLRRWFVERAVPFHRAIGLRLVEVAPDSSRVVLRLPPARRNRNVGGTVHGGVIAALAETAHGVAVLWQFPPATHRMVSRRLQVEFVAEGRGWLQVAYALDAGTRQAIEAGLSRSGRHEVELTSEVQDDEGRLVARLVGSYLIQRRSEPGRGRMPGRERA